MTITFVFLLLFTVCVFTAKFVECGEEFAKDKVVQPVYYDWNNETEIFVPKTLELPPDSHSLQSGFKNSSPWLAFRAHSQKGAQQDLVILSIFNDKTDGYFVDLAANNWQLLSNTLNLEHFNKWKGVCIEPNREYLEGLLANRKCDIFTNPVSYKSGLPVTFTIRAAFSGILGKEYDNTEKSSKWRYEEMVTVTLEQILDFARAPKVIDYLSLDVEGAEEHVLSKFPFDKYTFYAITVERPSKKVHHTLTIHGYRFVYILSGFGDVLYLHHSFPSFLPVMRRYHDGRNSVWDIQPHDYLLHPKWTGTYHPVGFIG
mmetsp:Transcript_16814/g.28525  ORF Transcript_16814/g.28525 Transcript_16814/m.28525 type:complete len:315 (-) Transcript_16814:380-1324(-)|eukprot:CAMPEP_0174994228 /NCGR_PEP_ID=MMETSP0004_2-20121128/23513_1 /TAXON_ID=420556 /ORGANISM="Ochromonas sp., Strain CCMP1393" /LENGTH=314 /DNA_ID=CAMNT_0016248429 /DNA_START=81 /DNA_END=1025 /DNA_ORIENTATION=+